MIKILFNICEDNWEYAKQNSVVLPDIIDSIMILKNTEEQVEKKYKIYINELYFQLVSWLKNDLRNDFVEFHYTSPVDFEDYFDIEKCDEHYSVYLPGLKMDFSKEEIIEFGNLLLQEVKKAFLSKGEEGVKYLQLLDAINN